MDVSELRPLPGGWSGRTFSAEVAGERTVVRVYPPEERGGVAAEIDAAVMRLVRGLVPVPEVLEVRPASREEDRPGLLVMSFVDGVRADELLPTLGTDETARLGAVLGGLVADLGGMPVLRAGAFVDADLRVEPWELDLPAYVAEHEPTLVHLSVDELQGLREVVLAAQVLLDTVSRTCLVHSDLNPKNLLLHPETLEVAAVLDWEYAHAGHPFTDLGNLLRFDRDPVLTDAVLAVYTARRGGDPAAALDLARAADLFALVELAGRRGDNPVAERADRLLRAIARSGDRHTAE